MVEDSKGSDNLKRRLPSTIVGKNSSSSHTFPVHNPPSLGLTNTTTLKKLFTAAPGTLRRKQTSLDFQFKQPLHIPTDISDKEYQKSIASSEKYTINGVDVRFPFKAYPFQIAMMGKIIKALKESENALLESPTGTGKTLTILTAVLAWREAERTNITNIRTEHFKSFVFEQEKQQTPNPPISSSSFFIGADTKSNNTPQAIETKAAGALASQRFANDNDDFMEAVCDHQNVNHSIAIKVNNAIDKIDLGVVDDGSEKSKALNESIPTIFIASRTQKQIQQIVRELREKSTYRPRISILGSREHYCINPQLKRSTNKGEECTSLIETDSCGYFNRTRQLQGHAKIQGEERNAIWDIEDLVTVGKRTRGCPYYAAKALAETAEVIFAPYNYIIDPHVRASSGISLENSILIIDEAHNIESSCMDSGSADFTEQEMIETSRDLEGIVKQGHHVDEYNTLIHLIKMFLDWRCKFEDSFTIHEFSKSLKIWQGPEISQLLGDMGILPGSIPMITQAYATIQETMGSSDKFKLLKREYPSQRSLQLIGGLVMILRFLFSFDPDFINDYRMVLTKSENESRVKDSLPWVYTFSFWCMNPAVIFKHIESMTKSIILTSGTMSPISSFSRELGVKFAHTLEAPHIIKDDQLCIGSLPSGANNMPLVGVYKSFETFDYQDQLGLSIARLANLIPQGLLVFLPSYMWLDKLMDRWRQTGLEQRLGKTKYIFTEPRANAKKELENLMAKYDSISSTESGAILFCVYRGKMSEGIDFSDHRARGVICVGLPFPNIKDIKVLQKRDYNTQRASSRGLLTGSEWYSMQAYRALNQALGRCIRHRNDWGAIILLDERFSQSRCTSNLSKWMRTKIRQWKTLQEAEAVLKSFFDYRIKAEFELKLQLEAHIPDEKKKREEYQVEQEQICKVDEPQTDLGLDTDFNTAGTLDSLNGTIENPIIPKSSNTEINILNWTNTSEVWLDNNQALHSQNDTATLGGIKKAIDLSKYSFGSKVKQESQVSLQATPNQTPAAAAEQSPEKLKIQSDIAISDTTWNNPCNYVPLASPETETTQSSPLVTLSCIGCGSYIVNASKAHSITTELSYALRHAQGSQIFAVGDDADMDIPFSVMASDSLNAYWCQVDGLAYAHGTCPGCHAIIGIRVLAGCDATSSQHIGHWFMFSNALSSQPLDFHTTEASARSQKATQEMICN
ncbi:hypothetical protein O5D80_002730 [Batrachochytrium dendrobatidis]|nr:hypothetical protein O5D80_002730 [Batrachochytrium dendrobatidis]